MKNYSVLFVLVLVFFAFQMVYAQEAALKVAEMEFCTGVQDREPVNADTTFLNTVETVYCFTKITGATEPTTVKHIWYHNENEMASVDLNVGGDNWRTWSSKRISEDWTGKWRVDVVSASGEVLMTKGFTIQ